MPILADALVYYDDQGTKHELITEVMDDLELMPKKIPKRTRPRLLPLSRVPIWIRIVLEEFQHDHKEWSTPKGARNECTYASEAFLTELCRQFPKYMEEVSWGVQEVTNDHSYRKYYEVDFDGGHDVARIGDLIIDWTARQFHPQAAYPRVWMQRWFPDSMRDPQIASFTSIAFRRKE